MPGFFNARELAGLRALDESAFDSVCSIQAKTVVQSTPPRGGGTETWATTYTNVPCRLVAQRTRGAGVEAMTAAEIREMSHWVLKVSLDQPLDHTNRVVCNGHTYEVLSVNDGRTYPTSKAAMLMRLDNA